MPLGIISDSEFNNELANCSSDSVPIPEINDSSNIDYIPSNDSSNPRASELIEEITDETAPQIIQASAKARGRGESNTQVPSGIRKIIGETSAINGRSDALKLAELFDVKPSSVSAYSKGAHSTSSINTPNDNTKAHIDASKLRVSTRARKKLNLALSHITDDKLAEAKVGEIASVAKAMAGVIKDMEPSTDNSNNKSNMPFIVYAPIIRHESSFEVVHAKDDY